jgi:hypothetical protein
MRRPKAARKSAAAVQECHARKTKRLAEGEADPHHSVARGKPTQAEGLEGVTPDSEAMAGGGQNEYATSCYGNDAKAFVTETFKAGSSEVTESQTRSGQTAKPQNQRTRKGRGDRHRAARSYRALVTI